MRDVKGRGIIRMGDKTSHGGEVVSAADSFTVLGKQVALEGDMATCPKCKGKFLIEPADNTHKHHGKRVAFEGDLTACGARLFSSV